MAQKFVLPDIGEGLVDAEIVKWHVAVGDTVGVDQVIVEVETAKAVVEIPSPYGGAVLELGGAEGDTIDVGAMLIVIGEETDLPAAAAETAVAASAASQRSEPERSPSATLSPAAAPVASSPTPELEPDAAVSGVATGVSHAALMAAGTGEINIARPRAMPVVRKAAKDAGVDLALVPGSGPGGAVTRRDLEAYLGSGAPGVATPPEEPVATSGAVPTTAVPTTAASTTAASETADPASDERQRMSRTRRTIAEHMSRSWQEIPHVTTFHEVDATRLLEARSALEKRLETSLPIETMVMKAVVPVLVEYPEFNATLVGEDVALHRRYDIGVAVDTPDGLIVPVIRSADLMTVAQLAGAIVDVASRARERRLTPDETTGHTFTVTNIGAIGGTHGTPIIPYGTTAILSIGRARPMPVVSDGTVAIATLLPLSLSFDHRVIDGALGQRFAARLAENLAEPALFLAG